MNIACPQQEFETDISAIKGFADLLKAGFQNPEGIEGTVKLHVPELPEHGFIARYADKIYVEWNDPNRETDTFVSMPIVTIKRIFKEFEYLDFRDSGNIGTMEFSGNLDYANHLGKSCLRPSNFTLERFKAVGALHHDKGYRNVNENDYLYQPTQRQILDLMNESCPAVITGLRNLAICSLWLGKRTKTGVIFISS